MQPIRTGFGRSGRRAATTRSAAGWRRRPGSRSDSDVLERGRRAGRAGTCSPCASQPTPGGEVDHAAGGGAALVPDRLRPGHAHHRLPVRRRSGQELARGALLALAPLQGKEVDDFKDEEPGKILHEIRTGELTQLGLKPHSPYYGTADATHALAHPAVRVLAVDRRRRRWSARCAATRSRPLDWIDQYGDRDGDGYVEYQTRSPQGLGNQCWRDSWDGVQFADGTHARTCRSPPARSRGTSTTPSCAWPSWPTGRSATPRWRQRLRDEATRCGTRFNRDFWIDERGGYYAIGLDGDKRQIDSLTSNIGHLLWSRHRARGPRRRSWPAS